MKVEQESLEPIFPCRYPKDATTHAIADAASATWRDINIALSPIIGQKGVAALVKRSLHLQHVDYPVLKAIHSSKILSSGFPTLHAVLIKETNLNAALINNALLNTFYELLTNLVGASLTHQLLHPVFVTPSNGDPVQDTLS